MKTRSCLVEGARLASLKACQRLALVGVASLVLACGPARGYGWGGPPAGTLVEYTPLNEPPREMKPRVPDRVELFAGTRPSRAFVEVGILDVRNPQYLAGTSEDLQARLRIEAGFRGCDGLILMGSAEGEMSVTGRALRSYQASCIAYRGPAPNAGPAMRAEEAAPTSVELPSTEEGLEDRQLAPLTR